MDAFRCGGFERRNSESLVHRLRCFNAQQAAEKAIKAVLILQVIDFPFSHDLNRLRLLLRDQSWLWAEENELESLTKWSMSGRYPTDWPDANAEDTERAVAIATSIVEAARAYIDRASA